MPNPRSGLVYEGIELCKKEKVNFILAVGGGSTIDSSKAIAAGVVYDGDFWDFYQGKRIEEALPVGTILTIAAAGSEGSPDSVITNEDGMNSKDVEVTDRLIESLILTMKAEAPKVMANLEDYEARAYIMWAGMVAHNNIVGVGRSQDWTSHQIEHELSALYDCAHGAGLAVTMPAVFTYNKNFEELAQRKKILRS